MRTLSRYTFTVIEQAGRGWVLFGHLDTTRDPALVEVGVYSDRRAAVKAGENLPIVGRRVRFVETSPMHRKNQGVTYIVEASPRGDLYSVSAEGVPFVWLVNADDVAAGKSPSRCRRRTGWVHFLEADPS